MPNPIQNLLQAAAPRRSPAAVDRYTSAQQPFSEWLTAKSAKAPASVSQPKPVSEPKVKRRREDNDATDPHDITKLGQGHLNRRRETAQRNEEKSDLSSAPEVGTSNALRSDQADVVAAERAPVDDRSEASADESPVDETSADKAPGDKISADQMAGNGKLIDESATPFVAAGECPCILRHSPTATAAQDAAADAEAEIPGREIRPVPVAAATDATIQTGTIPDPKNPALDYAQNLASENGMTESAPRPVGVEPAAAIVDAKPAGAVTRPEAHPLLNTPADADPTDGQDAGTRGDQKPQQDLSQVPLPAATNTPGPDIDASSVKPDESTDVSALQNLLAKVEQLPKQISAGASAPPQPASEPEAKFAARNHDNIVQNMQAKLLPDGGTMSIRLDPPELGDLQVTITMRDGTLNASFKTSNDDATRMLSHNLADLKSTLEAAGVVVDKIYVQQTPKDEQARNESRSSSDGRRQESVDDQNAARQDQQRKEMVRRLWRRLSLGRDELDMVA